MSVAPHSKLLAGPALATRTGRRRATKLSNAARRLLAAAAGTALALAPFAASAQTAAPYAATASDSPFANVPHPAYATLQTAPGEQRNQPPASSVITPTPWTPEPITPIDIDQLPATLTPGVDPNLRVANLAEETVAPENQMAPEAASELPPGARAGVFQKIYFTGTWLPRMSDEPDTLGMGDLEAGVVLGFPFFRRDTPLLVTPHFGTHLLENAAALDIPSTLYDASVDFRHLRKFGDGPWAMDVGVGVGYYSDFEQSYSNATRVTGRGIGVYEATPGKKWVFGVAYLNRAGATVLPIAGLIIEPAEMPRTRLDLIFPRPRFSWQTAASTPEDERWFYIGGEFGGGIWSITRPSDQEIDTISYSDIRVVIGFERKILNGLATRFETGYVFARELDYQSATPDVSLDDTMMARVGVTY
ncbi:DUF6268 family outer membrane beta-barrel protein [Lacipirellula sp.]|uniref:DUF6268 family outer membrane beta-barrel protein n=1 Tax=Lacipirellula sp. TaxID=2691419 RepID=UPI003D0FFB3E